LKIQKNSRKSRKSRKFEKYQKIRENQEFRGTLIQLDTIWSLFCGILTLTHPYPQLLGLRQFIFEIPAVLYQIPCLLRAFFENTKDKKNDEY
jgi:hypothetical protein